MAESLQISEIEAESGNGLSKGDSNISDGSQPNNDTAEVSSKTSVLLCW